MSEAPNLTSFVACQFWLLPLQKIELAETSIFARNILFEDYWGERQNISSSSVKVTNLLTFVIPTNTKKSWELKLFFNEANKILKHFWEDAFYYNISEWSLESIFKPLKMP